MCEIDGFDKTGESNFIIPVSDSQAYRQFGNSVVVPVINEIANICSHLLMLHLLFFNMS